VVGGPLTTVAHAAEAALLCTGSSSGHVPDEQEPACRGYAKPLPVLTMVCGYFSSAVLVPSSARRTYVPAGGI
jgi:hypothetical protein